MRTPTSPDADGPDYQPSPQERSTLETYLQRISEHAPRIKVGEAAKLAPDHPEPAVGQVLLMAALGTADHDFYGGLVRQLGEASAQGGTVDEHALNFMLSVVKGIKPRDQVEAMLAAQMAAVHMATLACARRLACADAPSDGAERALNRLSRTYVAQMDALARYRAGGEHDVSRPEVSAGEDGEAIFGNGTQAAHVEVPDAAVPRAEVPRTAVAPVAAPPTAAPRTEVTRAAVPRTATPRAQVPCTQVPRVTEPACRATAPPSRGDTTSPSQPEIAPAFARRARADAARSPA
jgi:hypothetical protein